MHFSLLGEQFSALSSQLLCAVRMSANSFNRRVLDTKSIYIATKYSLWVQYWWLTRILNQYWEGSKMDVRHSPPPFAFAEVLYAHSLESPFLACMPEAGLEPLCFTWGMTPFIKEKSVNRISIRDLKEATSWCPYCTKQRSREIRSLRYPKKEILRDKQIWSL